VRDERVHPLAQLLTRRQARDPLLMALARLRVDGLELELGG
jgi:hypothetical protein